MNFNLASHFYEQSRAHPENIALRVSGKSYSYGELAGFTARASAALGNAKTVGVLASRTLSAYVGILASSWSGAAYIPLSPTKLPDERLASILEIVRPDALVVDAAGLARMTPALRAVAPPLILDLSGQLDSLPAEKVAAPVLRGADDLAYVIFTSGTTGVPKGVVIKLGSVAQFLEAMQVLVKPVSTDKVSQTSELSFDVSVFEMFLAWGSGASVHVVPATQLMTPSHFITDHALTIWSSVPSIAAFMRGVKALKPGAFPSLRCSVFCGEALPYALAEAWQAAAPSSIVLNLYGPTEATVGCVAAVVGSDFPPTPTLNLVPSGLPLPGVEAAVLDESHAFLPTGEVGQLAIAGGQVAEGYYNESELTRERFPIVDGKRWYLTGDLTRRDERGVFHHLGRMDRQIKVMGQRVELEEIEAHLRAISDSDSVAAVAWPIEDGLVQGVVGFTSGASKPSQELLEALRRRLPSYMVPRRIVQLDQLPHTASGKIDRKALALSLNESPSLAVKTA